MPRNLKKELVKEKMTKKNNSLPSILLVVILTSVLGYFVYISGQQLEEELPKPTDQLIINPTTGSGGGPIDEDTNFNTNQSFVLDQQVESDNFQIAYSSNWQLTESEAAGIKNYTFVVGSDQVGLSVMSDDMVGIVEDSLSVEEETIITISGVSARKLKGGDLKDGSLVYSIILTKDGLLYNFNGRDGDKIDEIIGNFTFI